MVWVGWEGRRGGWIGGLGAIGFEIGWDCRGLGRLGDWRIGLDGVEDGLRVGVDTRDEGGGELFLDQVEELDVKVDLVGEDVKVELVVEVADRVFGAGAVEVHAVALLNWN